MLPSYGNPDVQEDRSGDGAGPVLSALVHDRDRLDRLLLPVADALVVVDHDDRIVYASPAVRPLIGFDPHTLVGQRFSSYIHPDDIESATTSFRPGPGGPTSCGVRVRDADGDFRTVTMTVTPPGDIDGVTTLSLRDAEGRRSTLDALRHRLAFEDLLTRVASMFIHRPSHEVGECIRASLADIGQFAKVDRAYVYVIGESQDVLELTHEWCRAAIVAARSAERTVPAAEMVRWLDALETEGVVYVPRTADLDERWAAERQRLDRYGARSVLAVPIADAGRTIGFIGFDLVGSDRFWSDDHIVVLTSTANIIAQAWARADAEQRFGLAFDRAPLGMAVHSSEGRHIQVNPSYCELVGRTEEELRVLSVFDLVDGEDHDGLVADHDELVRGRRDVFSAEVRVPRPDGSEVWVRVHAAAVRSDDGELRYTVAHIEDITERVRRDVELRASEQRYRTLVENSPALIIRYDRDLNPVFVSGAIQQMMGEAVETGFTPGVLFESHEADRWMSEITTVFDTGQRRDGEYEIVAGDDTIWYQSRAVPEFDETGLVEYVLVVSSDITALKRSEAELAHQALHDPLTGLANRALLLDFLDRCLHRRSGVHTAPALLFIDLDRFKLINDSLGHRAGDELLVAVADRLTSAVRPSDLIARLGGDEFVIVLDGIDDAREPVRVAERIKSELAKPIMIEGNEVVTSGSVGIALAVSPSADAEGLLRDADAAMYLAKGNGRNRYEIFDTVLRTQATEKLHMEAALRRALDDGSLEVFYQPELDLDSGDVVGFEALVRWHHPTDGFLSAWAFIELAEETGLIVELGEWVLREACLQAGRWLTERPERKLTLRVNLSGRQFAQPDLVQQVVNALADGHLDASSLCLEITETALMADPALGLQVLQDLRALGVELAIDDFGTGYSSLSYLKQFPVDVLKIDRSFVDGLGDDPDDTAIATAIISLAQSMGLRVVAEGVETRRQLDELRRLGCNGAQGYLFARPGPSDQAWELPIPYPVASLI